MPSIPDHEAFEALLATDDLEQIRFYYDRNIRTYKFIDDEVERVARSVTDVCQNVLGRDWNHYSNALLPEVCSGFGVVARRFDCPTVRYLEIGSNRGVSLAFFVSFLRHLGRKVEPVSIDPYFVDGYFEGRGAPLASNAAGDSAVPIDKSTKKLAFELYDALSINVRHIEKPSDEGLLDLIAENKKFEIIYIDGSHQSFHPLIDAGLAHYLAARGGVIILDDWHWRDVLPIKAIFDRNAKKIYECWKIAAYML